MVILLVFIQVKLIHRELLHLYGDIWASFQLRVLHLLQQESLVVIKIIFQIILHHLLILQFKRPVEDLAVECQS